MTDKAGQHRRCDPECMRHRFIVPVESDGGKQPARQQQAHGQGLHHGRKIHGREPESLMVQRIDCFPEYEYAIQHKCGGESDAKCEKNGGNVTHPGIEENA